MATGVVFSSFLSQVSPFPALFMATKLVTKIDSSTNNERSKEIYDVSRRVGSVSADASVGSDSLPYPGKLLCIYTSQSQTKFFEYVGLSYKPVHLSIKDTDKQVEKIQRD